MIRILVLGYSSGVTKVYTRGVFISRFMCGILVFPESRM
jgi:hypothetical protein